MYRVKVTWIVEVWQDAAVMPSHVAAKLHKYKYNWCHIRTCQLSHKSRKFKSGDNLRCFNLSSNWSSWWSSYVRKYLSPLIIINSQICTQLHACKNLYFFQQTRTDIHESLFLFPLAKHSAVMMEQTLLLAGLRIYLPSLVGSVSVTLSCSVFLHEHN